MIVPTFLSLSLADQKAMLAVLKQEYIQSKAKAKAQREADKAAKAAAKQNLAAIRAERQAAAIVKAQARLDKLLAKQAGLVGSKAAKANRRPSKVTTYGAEDNAIAAAIMAKKKAA